jgi:hypothetical protein
MAGKKFEKQKLDRKDYEKEEKRISISKRFVAGAATVVLALVAGTIKTTTGKDLPSSKA